MKRKQWLPSGSGLTPPEVYARDVAGGKIICSHQVRLACQRHWRDITEAHDRRIFFDPEAAQHAIDFFQFLHHSKGEWAGQRFELQPWQQFILWSLFGWYRNGGLRRFRTAYVAIARKNGKSTLAAGIGLYLFFADNEPGAEVYCAATQRDQARIVFDEAVRMRNASPALAQRIDRFRDNMNVPDTASKFEPLGADEDPVHGLNIHGAIVDELHLHKTRSVWDAIETGTAARRQPLIFAITTAGFNRQSVCWHQDQYCRKVLESLQQDDSLFAFIAEPDPEDDWENEKVWAKANPNLGVSVKLDDLRRKAEKAKADPSALNSFLRLHLNQWTQTDTRWMALDKWNLCSGFPGADPKRIREELELQMAGRRCFGGLDLSSKIDLTAFALLFTPIEGDSRWIALVNFWMPEDNVAERIKRDRVPYDIWIREGFIQTTEGNVIHYDAIRAHVLQARDRFDIQEIAFDPWNATQLSTQLQGDGLTMVEHRQGFGSMSGPTKELMTLVLGRKLAHLGNPVLRWMASNLVVKTDEAGNIKPNKEKSAEKIDGLVALIMALGRAQAADPDAGLSVYESQDIFTI